MKFVRILKAKNKQRYDIILEGEIKKSNLTEEQVIEYYNDITQSYYEGNRRYLSEDEYQESVKIGPKFAKTFNQAVQGLSDLFYHVEKHK